MTAVTHDAPRPLWRAAIGGAQIRCLGRGAAPRLPDLPRALGEPGLAPAWLRQVHSSRALRAAPGPCGEGDALVTDEPGLALCVVTADCVPIVVGGDGALAVIHAGWRGLVGGVVRSAHEALPGTPTWAWIGPAIGRCCYEVGEDVAGAVARATGAPDAVVPGDPRPRLDLARAARSQLAALGIRRIEAVAACTRCSPDLWSHRGDGPGAGRNVTVAWLEGRGRPTEPPRAQG